MANDTIKPVVQLDINDAFYNLHMNALSATNPKSAYKVEILNLGVDEQNKTFLGSGEFSILTHDFPEKKWADISADSDYQAYVTDLKDRSKKALYEYLKEFINEDIANDFNSKADDALEEVKKTKPITEGTFDYRKTLLENIVITEDDDQVEQVVGFSVPYVIQLQLQSHGWTDFATAFKRSTKKVLGLTIGTPAKFMWKQGSDYFKKALGDILNVKVQTMDGKEYGIDDFALTRAGKALVKGAWDMTKNAVKGALKSIFTEKDLETLRDDLKRALNKKFQENIIDVKVIPTDQLLTNLRKQKRIDSKLLKGLLNNSLFHRMSHCLCVFVSDEDENKDLIDEKALAELFNQVFSGPIAKVIRKSIGLAALKPDKHIVKIKEYKTNFRISRFRQPRLMKNSLDNDYTVLRLIFEDVDKYEFLTEATVFDPRDPDVVNKVRKAKQELISYLQQSDRIAKYIHQALYNDDTITDASIGLSGLRFSTRQSVADELFQNYKDGTLASFFTHWTVPGAYPKFGVLYDAIIKHYKDYQKKQLDNQLDNNTLADLYIFMLPNLKYEDDEYEGKSAKTSDNLKPEK